eukprot:2093454-Pleurochrysis_carterae.AAC.1
MQTRRFWRSGSKGGEEQGQASICRDASRLEKGNEAGAGVEGSGVDRVTDESGQVGVAAPAGWQLQRLRDVRAALA